MVKTGKKLKPIMVKTGSFYKIFVRYHTNIL